MAKAAAREDRLAPAKGVDAGALSVMASFNELSGVPANGNHWLQTVVLRGEWGFKGFVVSDFARQIAEIGLGRREPVVFVGDIDVTRDFTGDRPVEVQHPAGLGVVELVVGHRLYHILALSPPA